jgi:hypothetical protein
MWWEVTRAFIECSNGIAWTPGVQRGLRQCKTYEERWIAKNATQPFARRHVRAREPRLGTRRRGAAAPHVAAALRALRRVLLRDCALWLERFLQRRVSVHRAPDAARRAARGGAAQQGGPLWACDRSTVAPFDKALGAG